MLPPNTSSSLLPWSLVVLGMQMNGCFPYKMSAKGDARVFSLCLFFWAALMQLLMITTFVLAFEKNFLEYLYYDLGTATYVGTIIALMLVLCVAPVLLGVRSRLLADLLHEMSAITCFPPTPALKWTNPKTMALLLLLICFASFTLWFCFTKLGFTSITEMIMFAPVCLNCCVGFMLPQEASSMVFGLMARRLVAETEATVATVSTLLTSGGYFRCESDVQAAMLALRDLDAVIREVEVQREKGTRCFFPVVTLYMLMAVLFAVASPYALMNGTLMGGTPILTEVLAFYIMLRFTHLGQAFVNEVSVAQGLLKELKIHCLNPLLTQKVSQVMESLSPLLIFDMRGWYRLDYATFVTLGNTVLTYEMIIFQMGGAAINQITSSALSNSTTKI